MSWFVKEKAPQGSSPLADVLPVLLDKELLQTETRAIRIRQLASLVRVPKTTYSAFYLQPLNRLAEFVQQLPASEAHHHAYVGGLLDHALEVIVHALALRRRYLLPLGAEPEIISRKQELWTYAVFSAALLHDIGKAAVDQQVHLYDRRGEPLGRWDPWQGPIKDAAWYRIAFNRDREYFLHERVATLLAPMFIPSQALGWMGKDAAVISCWIACITGDVESAGAIGEIVGAADRASVARDLGVEASSVRAGGARKPLQDKLLTALRFLLKDGTLPLNRNGAAGWLKGDDLWLVSKRAVDVLRDHLTDEGHEGVPSRNDRIFDILQEHRLILPFGDQAIWHATVSGEGWSHKLTMLRFPAQRIWPSADARPDEFSGTVVSDDTQLVAGQASGATELVENTGSDNNGNAGTRQGSTKELSDKHSIDGPQAVFLGRGAGQQAINDSADTAKHVPAPGALAAQHFLTWVQENIRAKALLVNDVSARIHTVPEGVLLVSPGIFKDFVTANPGSEGNEDWALVQKRFQKLRLHKKTAGGTNIHRYQVKGSRKKAAINGLVIPDAHVVFGDAPIPTPNPHLKTINE